MTNPNEAPEVELTEEEIEQQLPKPVGYHILVMLPKVEDKYESGIIKAERTQSEEYILSSMGAVIDMGDQAYADKERFPTGAWCKVGDFVMFRPNTGTRFKVNGQEMRLMNDDSIQAIVPNPKGIMRAC